jgi:hypothetical protein
VFPIGWGLNPHPIEPSALCLLQTHPIEELQGAIGNQAVNQLIGIQNLK